MNKIFGDTQQSLLNPLDVLKEKKKSGNIEQNNDKIHVSSMKANVDYSWLSFAAKTFNISNNIDDYIIVPCITILSDMPNANGVSFPLKELVAWNISNACQGYKTFKGKPTFLEHASENIDDAKGIILDVLLKKALTYGSGKVWKVVELLSFDRTKDDYLVNNILSGQINSYSMGSYVQDYSCSFCGKMQGLCDHLPKEEYDGDVTFYEHEGKIVYKQVVGMQGFETSAVSNPAFVSAISDKTWNLQKI